MKKSNPIYIFLLLSVGFISIFLLSSQKRDQAVAPSSSNSISLGSKITENLPESDEGEIEETSTEIFDTAFSTLLIGFFLIGIGCSGYGYYHYREDIGFTISIVLSSRTSSVASTTSSENPSPYSAARPVDGNDLIHIPKTTGDESQKGENRPHKKDMSPMNKDSQSSNPTSDFRYNPNPYPY